MQTGTVESIIQRPKIGLLQNGRKEFSELVEELLHQWLKSST
jgi:hypothetical protein